MESHLYEVEWPKTREKIDSAIRRNFIITLLQLVENDEFIRIVWWPWVGSSSHIITYQHIGWDATERWRWIVLIKRHGPAVDGPIKSRLPCLCLAANFIFNNCHHLLKNKDITLDGSLHFLCLGAAAGIRYGRRCSRMMMMVFCWVSEKRETMWSVVYKLYGRLLHLVGGGPLGAIRLW